MSFFFGIGTASGSSLFAFLFGGESLVWTALSGSDCCAMALVDHKPWRCVCMCTFWVSSDSGKNVFTFHVDKGKCEVFSIADGLHPDCLCGESCGAMEVADGWFDAGEVVYIID